MTGKPFLDKILIGLNALVVLGAMGLILYSHHGIKRAPTNQSQEADKLIQDAKDLIFIKPYSMKSFTVNLYSKTNRLRFLEVEMNIVPFDPSQVIGLKNAETIIKDSLIQIAAEMDPDDVGSVTGKILLENRLKKAVNDRVGGQPLIKQILFSRFVIQ
jgi:flagellar FliL protein